MLGLILVGAWMSFVAAYLIWQQLTGDLADNAVSYQHSAAGVEQVAQTSIAVGEDPRDVRRSLVYRSAGLRVAGGQPGLTAEG